MPQQHRRARLSPVAGAIVAGLLLSGGLMFGGSYAAFRSATSNDNNKFALGTVNLTDDDNGFSMFTIGAPGTGQVSAGSLKPGQSVTNCVNVSYTGSLPSTVKMWASSLSETMPNGTGAKAYLHVLVEEGTGGAFGCAGFTGATIIYDSAHPAAQSDLLSAFPTTYATGVDSGQSPWTNGTSRAYRFTFAVDGTVPDTSQGATATVTFTWQAQNT